MSNPPRIVGRRRSPSMRRQKFHERLDEIIDLSDASELADYVPFPDPEKASKSRQALIEAGNLIAPLIGWAIEHQAGMILNKTSMPFFALRGHENDPRFAEAKKLANASEHEERGAKYDLSDQAANREIIALLLSTVLTGQTFFQWAELAEVAAEALRALNEGEERPLLKKPKKSRKGQSYKKDRLQQRACEHVAFRQGKGIRRDRAILTVAKAYRMPGSTRTIEDWITEANKKYRTWFSIQRAKEIGKTHVERLKQAKTREQIDHANWIGSEYSDAKLEADGNAHYGALSIPKESARKRNARKYKL